MSVDRWVIVDLPGSVIKFGPFDWNGPTGVGHFWSQNNDGTIWTSEQSEVRSAPGDLTKWSSPVSGYAVTEAYALIIGYTYPEPPPYEELIR